jgi:hypothetical protein
VKKHISKLTKPLRTKSFSSSRFSRANLTIFGIVFAAIGGYIIYSSFAATPTTANLWVDTNGGSCTYSSTPVAYNDAAACGTFDAAWDKVSSGNTIVVKPGIYGPQKVNGDKTSETKFIGEGDGNDVIVRNNGVECEHIYGATSAFCAQAAYMTLENMVLDSSTVLDANSAIRIWNDNSDGQTPFYNAHHVTLRHVDLWGNYPNMQVLASDFTWQGGSHGQDGVLYPLICAGGSEPVWLADGADRTVIDGVRFNPKRTDQSGSCDPHIETIRFQGDVDDVTIKNSWFVAGSDAGSGHIFTGAGTTANRAKFINNIFEPLNGSATSQASGTCDWVFEYNTFLQGGLFDDGCSGTNNQLWVGNVATTTPSCGGTHIKNVWQGSSNTTACGGADKIVTGLGLTANGRIQAGSSALDAGEVPGASDYCTGADIGGRDFEGTVRPQGAACDAGADELGGPSGETANIWIDTNGGTCTRNATPAAYNDAQACTPAAAISAAQASDLILIKGGSYSSITLSKAVTVHPASTESVVFTGGVTVSAGGAIIDGGDTVGVDETNRITAGDLTLSGDTTTDKVIEDVSGASGVGLGINGNHSVFRYSELGPNNPCTQTEDLIFAGRPGTPGVPDVIHNVQIVGNYLHDHGPNTPCPNVHSDMMDIQFGDSLIAYNVFVGGCSTQCIFNASDSPQQANAMHNVDIIGNYFGDSQTIAVQCDGECELDYNTFGTGLGLAYRAGPFEPTVMTLTGNVWMESVSCSSTNVPGSTVTHSYSVFPTAQGSACGTGSTLANVSLTGSGASAGHIATASESAVAGKGNPSSCPTVDFDNQTRPQPSATTCDAGADEVGGSITPPAPPPPPPTPPTPPAPPGTQLVGNNAVEGLADSLASGQTEAWPFTATATGSAATAALYLDSSSTASGVLLGLYSDNSGAPGTLLATATISAPVSGWNSATFSSPPSITSGTNYWIAVLGTGTGQVVIRDRGTGGTCNARVNAAPNNWTSLHNPFGSLDPTLFAQCPISAYIVAASSSGTKVGDLNADNIVNIFDLSIMLSKYNTNNAAADLNSDGTVNIFDLSILLSHYGM